MPPRSKIGGILLLSCLSFCHSVLLSFCHSVIPSFCHSLWNFNLDNNFWTVRARAFIFHMSISCDKTFPWVPLFFTMWPWPWSLTYFLKTLTLLIIFEQWLLDRWYFTWVILVTRPFRVYHYFWPCDLDLWVWRIFFYKQLTFVITSKQYVLELSYCTRAFHAMRSSYW